MLHGYRGSMSLAPEALLEQALSLSPADRARLVRRLLASLTMTRPTRTKSSGCGPRRPSGEWPSSRRVKPARSPVTMFSTGLPRSGPAQRSGWAWALTTTNSPAVISTTPGRGTKPRAWAGRPVHRINGTSRRLKVEINLDDVPAAVLLDRRHPAVDTDWVDRRHRCAHVPARRSWLVTKFRALALRSKGRDLTDPPTAGDPQTLVHRWICWSDQHLDLPFARLAHDHAPSNRRARAIADLEHLFASNDKQCPIHELDGATWRRCPHNLSDGRCPDHGET